MRIREPANIAPLRRGGGIVVLAFALAMVRAIAETPDVVSPLVSYQFPDSPNSPPEHPNVVSPLVSYQYLDWPGDGNFTFEHSPSVSYYFGGDVSLAFGGVVKDTAGQPVSGAHVILSRYNTVFWQGHSAADGSFPTADLPAGNFNVVVIKAGYTSLFQNVPGNEGGPVFLNLTLRSAIELPTLVTVDRAPEETAIRPPELTDPSLPRPLPFKVFSGTSFSSDAPLDPHRMTIVISHGWKSSLSTWAAIMAYQIKSRHALGSNVPNIVGWDWSHRANTTLPPIDEACLQGEAMGRALIQQLGPNYNQRLHFIGHSLGTIVNAYACNHLHATFSREQNNPTIHWNANLTQPHVTLLDEAEVTTVFGQNVATAAAIGWQSAQFKGALLAGSVTAAKDWKSPVPGSAAWVDNYISLVGLQRNDAVNVCLPALVFAYDVKHPKTGLENAHAYAHLWYRNSIGASGSFPQVGFRSSYESALSFPPFGAGLNSGSLWYENLDTSELLDLRLQPNPQPFEANIGLLSYLAVSSGAQVGSVPGSVGQQILNSYEAGIQWVGDRGGTAIHKTGQVTVSVGEKIGNLWDAALDKVSSINPDTLFTGSIAAPTFKLSFTTPWSSPSGKSVRSQDVPSTSPQAWMPLRVPANAGFLAFDFTVTGDPTEDLVVCAINGQNLFTLPARFAPDDSPVSTDFLDISAYAGQEVELYFGLVGGTSSGCTLAIDGIRFVTIPMPKLAATASGENVKLEWPAAAAGWKLQRNSGLAPEDWEDVILPETVEVENGIITLERPKAPYKEFFRLKRAE